jgi:hypothetical protein
MSAPGLKIPAGSWVSRLALLSRPRRFGRTQPLGHRITVLAPQVAIGFGDQHPPVPVALPRGDGFEIHTKFDGPGDEAAAK